MFTEMQSARRNDFIFRPSASYSGVADDVSFDGSGELLLVVGAGEPALPFGWQGGQGLVCGPEDGERLVDGHLEHWEQTCILKTVSDQDPLLRRKELQ